MKYINIIGAVLAALLFTLPHIGIASDLTVAVKGKSNHNCFAEKTENPESIYVFCDKPYYLSMWNSNTSIFGRFNKTKSKGTLHIAPDGFNYIEIIPDT